MTSFTTVTANNNTNDTTTTTTTTTDQTSLEAEAIHSPSTPPAANAYATEDILTPDSPFTGGSAIRGSNSPDEGGTTEYQLPPQDFICSTEFCSTGIKGLHECSLYAYGRQRIRISCLAVANCQTFVNKKDFNRHCRIVHHDKTKPRDLWYCYLYGVDCKHPRGFSRSDNRNQHERGIHGWYRSSARARVMLEDYQL